MSYALTTQAYLFIYSFGMKCAFQIKYVVR